jgi:hypothetical protein
MQLKLISIRMFWVMALSVLIGLPIALVFGLPKIREFAGLYNGEVEAVWNPDREVEAYYLANGVESSTIHKVLVRKRRETSRHVILWEIGGHDTYSPCSAGCRVR